MQWRVAPRMQKISDGPLKLRLNIPSRWLRQVSVGTPFEVDINETGRTYQAKVTLINARVDAVAQTSARQDFGNLILNFNLAAGPLATLPRALSPELVVAMNEAGHSNTVMVLGDAKKMTEEIVKGMA